MTVISNSTPLIYLAAIGKFDILKALFGRIGPQSLLAALAQGGAGALLTDEAKSSLERLAKQASSR